MNRFRPHPTPNPDSLKVTTTGGPFTDRVMVSFASPAEAAANPLGKALFDVDGVANVFMMQTFLTVTKTRESSWNTVWPAVSEVLERHLGD